uniref:Si:ch211-215c18.3 n=1 Tax=Paramormyrops kingsleyae TaxID=1676925 RepID=A0A3B3QD85_9TELE
ILFEIKVAHRNLRVDCEFPPTYKTPGPYCEFKQDSRLAGSTRPGAQPLLDLKRRANVSLVNPTLCRLVYARLPGTSDEKAYTYTCRVIQGDVALENTCNRNVPVCSALTIQSTSGFLFIAMSLPVILGFLTA